MKGVPRYPWLQPYWEHFAQAIESGNPPTNLLLTGPAGSGKRYLADQWAQALLCQDPDLSADEMNRAFGLLQSGNHPDLIIISPVDDATTIKVEAIRDMLELAVLSPQIGRRKVILIDPAEVMTPSASDGLLKTLEEPSGGCHFILVCHAPDRLRATIRSRCRRVSIFADRELAARWLGEVCPAADPSLLLALSGNAPLRALDLVESGRLELREEIVAALVDCVTDKRGRVEVGDDWASHELGEVVEWLARCLRDAVVLKSGGRQQLVNHDLLPLLHQLADALDSRELVRMYARAIRLGRIGERFSGLRPDSLIDEILDLPTPN